MQSLMTFYERLVLDRPRLSLALLAVVVGFFAMFVSDFRLDASTESLLLEQDSDLRYYRGIRARSPISPGSEMN
jgi:predicted RND superfamily exporter protein